MTRTLAAGIALTIIASGIAKALWGPAALMPAAVFGALSTAIQLAANWCNARWAPGPKTVFPKGWLYGMALRLGGVVLFAAAAFASVMAWRSSRSTSSQLSPVPAMLMQAKSISCTKWALSSSR